MKTFSITKEYAHRDGRTVEYNVLRVYDQGSIWRKRSMKLKKLYHYLVSREYERTPPSRLTKNDSPLLGPNMWELTDDNIDRVFTTLAKSNETQGQDTPQQNDAAQTPFIQEKELAAYREHIERSRLNESIIEERRRKQAKALWMMYNNGELIRQTIVVSGNYGSLRQEVLYSHLSFFAV